MDPFRAGAALHRPTPPGHISRTHRAGKDAIKVRVSVASHQKEENNNTGKKEAGEENKQAIDFID